MNLMELARIARPSSGSLLRRIGYIELDFNLAQEWPLLLSALGRYGIFVLEAKMLHGFSSNHLELYCISDAGIFDEVSPNQMAPYYDVAFKTERVVTRTPSNIDFLADPSTTVMPTSLDTIFKIVSVKRSSKRFQAQTQHSKVTKVTAENSAPNESKNGLIKSMIMETEE